MTSTEVAIRFFEKHLNNDCLKYGERPAIHMAIAALREQEEYKALKTSYAQLQDCLDQLRERNMALDKTMQDLASRIWISMEDRLPEVGQRVLTLDNWGRVIDQRLCRFRYGVLLFQPGGFIPGRDVTHWAPLPKLPEEV